MMIATALVLLLARQVSSEAGLVEYIYNASEFENFAIKVNSGLSYLDTTVYLMDDIDFSKINRSHILPTIGDSMSNDFMGTFDGMGHTISRLNIISDARYVGLFGYTEGAIIKNFVLDSTTSVESTYFSSKSAYVGGILGYCIPKRDACLIDNIVISSGHVFSVASSSSSTATPDIAIGGIVGCLFGYSYAATVKNCVNYAMVYRSNYYLTATLGGIVGSFYGNDRSSITNCLNYGEVIVSGVPSSAGTTTVNIGGILGFGVTYEITNCMSTGKVTPPWSSFPDYSYSGSIVGNTQDLASNSVKHCIWTSNTTKSAGYGCTLTYMSPVNSYLVGTVNTTTITELNNYVSGESRWMLNSAYDAFTLSISGRKDITYKNSIVLLYKTFTNTIGSYSGNYKNQAYTTSFSSTTATQSTVYGKWTNYTYTASFDYRNGTVLTAQQQAGYAIQFPEAIRIGYKFLGWNTDGHTLMPDEPYTFYAEWERITYYVTYDYGYDNKTTVTTYWYGDTIDYYPTVGRTGFEFLGWKNDYTTMPAMNITITAIWRPIDCIVSFNFDNGTIINQTYHYGDTIEYPTDIGRVGYEFNTWYPKYKTMPLENFTTTAQWDRVRYYVTYDYNYDNKSIILGYLYGDTIDYYPDEIRTGYEIVEWKSDYTTMPAMNITITAIWRQIDYTISFDFDNGTIINQTFHYGDKIEYPTDIGRIGYEISQWEPEYREMPAMNVTTVARWYQVFYVIIIDFGYTIDSDKYAYGDTVTLRDPDPWPGHVFLGWDKEITTMPAEEVYITALWLAFNYTLTFDLGNGTMVNETYQYGDKIEYPELGHRMGWKALGWDSNATTMPDANITITALWEEHISNRVKVELPGTLSVEELLDIMKGLTSKSMVVEKVETTEGGSTTVTIAFEDDQAAKGFVNAVENGESGLVDIVCEYVYDNEELSSSSGNSNGNGMSQDDSDDGSSSSKNNGMSGVVTLYVSVLSMFAIL